MIKVLITGKNSYVGSSLEKWLLNYSDKYSVDKISVRDNFWKSISFSEYDTIFHVAAIVHKKENPNIEGEYFKINKDLAVEVAKKAKNEGVKQFIFMSTMSVYGLEGRIGKNVIITKKMQPNPITFYGKSKLEAERELHKLNNEDFKVAIVRPPMVYGHNCPGNYERLKKLVLKVPLFPILNNQRSMIYIDNLTEFIRLIIENQEFGIFWPQNKEYVDTSELVNLIVEEHSKRIYLCKVLSLGVKLFSNKLNILNKVFGNLVYDSTMSAYKDFKYCIYNLKESIEITENSKYK